MKIGTLKVDQLAPICDLLEEENLTDCNLVNISMKAGSIIEMNKVDDYYKTDLKAYQCLIGKLIYPSCGTKSDIAFAVGQLSKRNADPRVGHLRASKRVVRYLNDTMHLEITYGTSKIDPKPYGLMEYDDSNYAGNPKDKKSVMRHCSFINGAVASWCSKKQQTANNIHFHH